MDKNNVIVEYIIIISSHDILGLKKKENHTYLTGVVLYNIHMAFINVGSYIVYLFGVYDLFIILIMMFNIFIIVPTTHGKYYIKREQ